MSEFLHKYSVGPVVPQTFEKDYGEQGFMLESGKTLPALTIRYETYGTLNADKSNVVWVCSPLTADAHVAGYYTENDKKPGWWDALIGPGKPVDTDKFFVVCSNILGGCKGTTGPASINPRTGKPYGSTFPMITIGDMVNAQRELAKGLGVEQLCCVIGGSMGGFQAMKWLEANDKTAVICHDYEGVARWAKGEWKAKSSIAQKYVEACRPLVHRVSFEKVAAHTGVKWNEAVDKLAKDAIAREKKGPASVEPKVAPSAPAEPKVAPSEPVEPPVAKSVPEPIKDPKTGQMSLPL